MPEIASIIAALPAPGGALRGSWKNPRFSLSLRRFRVSATGIYSHVITGGRYERNQVSWSGRAGKRGGRFGREPDTTRLSSPAGSKSRQKSVELFLPPTKGRSS